MNWRYYTASYSRQLKSSSVLLSEPADLAQDVEILLQANEESWGMKKQCMLSCKLVTAVCACSWEIPNVHLELPVRRSITALFNLCPPSLRALVAPSVWVKQLALVAHWNCSCCAQLVAYLTELAEKECVWSRPVPRVASSTAHFCVALPKCRIHVLDCALLPKHGHAFPEYMTLYWHKDWLVLTNDYFIIIIYREQDCLIQ